MREKISVIGLGYVGLPLVVGLARTFDAVVGFDIDPARVASLKSGHDWTGETESAALTGSRAELSDSLDALSGTTFFIVTVPTPINDAKRPDLKAVLSACRTVGAVLKKDAAILDRARPPIVVFESTVYPGLTEDICGPAIEAASGLTRGVDFVLGYSPERINPGDATNKLETIVKIISAENAEALARLDTVYSSVVKAGLHKASSIRVAEAAKVLENTQRDLNVALMNELAIICDHLDIRTRDVLDAAGTKWNFLKFSPGLVGGHCIGVDPYYLTARAEELGYHPQVILAGRRINDGMPLFIAQKIVKLLVKTGRLRVGARVGILGLTFKENVRDLRNSRVPDIVRELQDFGLDVAVHDPHADPDQARHEYGIAPVDRSALTGVDALVLAVSHKAFLDDLNALWPLIAPGGCVIDVKSVMDPASVPNGLAYWSL